MMNKYLYTGGYSGKIDSFLWADDTLTKSSSADCLNPSYLCFHPTKNICYAGVECGEETKISAYNIGVNGELSYVSSVSTSGSGLCHLIATEKAVYGADYNSGHVVAYKLCCDGKLGKLVNLIQHVGSSTHPRQEKAHAHQVVLSPDSKKLIAVDLGTNKLHVYDIKENGSLDESSVITSEMPEFEGPRHIVFKNDKEAYLITELGNKVIKLSYDNGVFTCMDTINLVDEVANNSSAEIGFMPNTDYLYASVRGVDKILVIDTKTFSIISSFDCGGKSPRMFSFDESGKHLFVANQSSNNIAVFNMNTTTGEMIEQGLSVDVVQTSYALLN